jgi:hypothetical protein
VKVAVFCREVVTHRDVRGGHVVLVVVFVIVRSAGDRLGRTFVLNVNVSWCGGSEA